MDEGVQTAGVNRDDGDRDHCAPLGPLAGVGVGVVRGRSGRIYRALPVAARAAVEGDLAVYALELGGTWGWVGAAVDLIDDPQSRARFRSLSAAGAALYRLDVDADARDRLAIAWDLIDMAGTRGAVFPPRHRSAA